MTFKAKLGKKLKRKGSFSTKKEETDPSAKEEVVSNESDSDYVGIYSILREKLMLTYLVLQEDLLNSINDANIEDSSDSEDDIGEGDKNGDQDDAIEEIGSVGEEEEDSEDENSSVEGDDHNLTIEGESTSDEEQTTWQNKVKTMEDNKKAQLNEVGGIFNLFL